MYRTSSSKDRSILEYAGTLSHKFDMSKAPSAPEADDAALMELQTKLADHEKQKQNNTSVPHARHVSDALCNKTDLALQNHLRQGRLFHRCSQVWH